MIFNWAQQFTSIFTKKKIQIIFWKKFYLIFFLQRDNNKLTIKKSNWACFAFLNIFKYFFLFIEHKRF